MATEKYTPAERARLVASLVESGLVDSEAQAHLMLDDVEGPMDCGTPLVIGDFLPPPELRRG